MNLQMLNCAGLRFAVLDGRWAIACCFLGVCMSVVEVANAQQEQLWNNQRKKWLPVKADTLVVDSLSLVPGSLHIADVADSCFIPHELQATWCGGISRLRIVYGSPTVCFPKL